MSYGVFSEFYDALTANVSYDTVSQVLSSLLTRYGKGRGLLLDLACGTGSVSVRLAKRAMKSSAWICHPKCFRKRRIRRIPPGRIFCFCARI